MVTAAVNSGRSNNGCWTCRLRKKKCDEHRPACLTCNSLGLDCSGYGPRPFWMDRGVLEREQARVVKSVINQTRSRARKRQSPPHDAAPMRLEGSPAVTRPLSGHAGIPATLHGGAASHADIYKYDLYERNPLSLHEPPWSDALYHNPLYGQPAVMFNGIPGPTTNLHETHHTPDSISPETSESAYLSTPALSAMTDANTFTDSLPFLQPSLSWGASNNVENSQPSVPSPLSRAPRSEGNIPRASGSNRDDLATSETSFDVFGQLTNEREPDQHQYAEDTLLMCYLDCVFYVQYPFFESHNSQGRGWLLSTLRRFKSVYYATLALSGCYQKYTVQSSHNTVHVADDFGLHDRFYNQALREMQLSLGQSQKDSTGAIELIHSIETLTCTLQFLFIEIFRGGRENWQMHLAAAASSVQTLFQAQALWLASFEIASHVSPHPKPFIHSSEESAVKFLLGSVVSIDIISCASIRSGHFISLDHHAVLEKADIQSESVTGCRNWALHSILNISRLDEWKRQAERAQQLSVAELAKRGSAIKADIDAHLDAIPAKPTPSKPASAPSAAANDPGAESSSDSTRSTTTTWSGPDIYDDITSAFALAATTYLHVVVSGAYPELPEIRESVTRALALFQTLPDARMLRHLVWPFCVSACLAVEGQYGVWRALAAAAEVDCKMTGMGVGNAHAGKEEARSTSPSTGTVGTLGEAVRIVEECWRARRTSEAAGGAARAGGSGSGGVGPGSCDWVTAMKRLGHHVLLW